MLCCSQFLFAPGWCGSMLCYVQGFRWCHRLLLVWLSLDAPDGESRASSPSDHVQKWWICAVFRGSSQWYITEPCLNAQHIASYFWCVFRLFDRASICCLMCSWQRDQLRMECKTYSRWVYVLSLSCYHANDQSLMPIEATELLFVWISHICSVVQAHENPL